MKNKRHSKRPSLQLFRIGQSVGCAGTLLISFVCTAHVIAQDLILSQEGKQRQAAHEYLFGEFAENRQLTVTDSANGKILQQIVVSTDRHEFTEELLLDLPEGSQRVISQFRYLILKGENLDKLDGLTLLPYAPSGHMHHSKQNPDFYRVQVASMPVPTEDMPPIQIKSKIKDDSKVVVAEVLFDSQGRLGVEFDTIPFRNLGAEFPRQPVKIQIVTDRELSIAGHVDLEREKWFRYYAAPGQVHESFEQWAADRNFRPGRQIFKFQPALVKGYSPTQPKLKELANRPGSADLSFFDRYQGGPSKTIPRFENTPYAMCFDNWPDFMSIQPDGRGTPKIENFDAAAELAAAYVKNEIADGGRTATWWEVKNESTIKSEWDYHWNDKYDSWALMAEFHNKVADAIRQSSPDVKVGGPSSAWMQVQVKDFVLYRSQQKFMDLTRGKMDFYSHHFYENIGSLGAFERIETNYTNYLLGRLEAILDMFVAHMHATDNVRPILITECGSLQAGNGPADYWLRIRSYSAYLVKMMQRPQQIDLVVPFAFMNIPWNPTSGDAAFIPKPGKRPNGPIEDFDSTPVKDFFELWRDFDGKRLPVRFDQPWLDVVAVHNADAIRVALTNMGGRRLAVDLSGSVKELDVRGISQRRLYYEDGQVKYQDKIQVGDASQIPVDVEETTIVTIALNDPLEPTAILRKNFFYAGPTAVKFEDQPLAEFSIDDLDISDSTRSATLVIGVQRDGGLDTPLEGTINGQPFSVNVDWASNMRHLFAPVRVNLDPTTLRSSINIAINKIPGLTITSVHLESISETRR